jgi:hypothetical protein
MADKDELLSQFRDVTGIDAERAKFYLESSAWRLEVSTREILIVRNESCKIDFQSSRASSNGVVTREWAGRAGFDSRLIEYFFPVIASRLYLALFQGRRADPHPG